MSGERAQYGYKGRLVSELLSEFRGEEARVLDLGCGTCRAFVSALKLHPNVAYTGVEQDAGSLSKARQAIGHLPNVELHEGFGEAFDGEDFDLVISLSVLEHVKHLDDFLSVSVAATRPGGRLVHRYDLGHALTPSTRGERLRVAVARRIPALVPAARFTTYPDLDRIVQCLRELGVNGIEVSQAQLPSLKAAMNLIETDTPAGQDLCSSMVELDARIWRQLGPHLDRNVRDRLFPAVTISGRRT
jgi:SAM-dependent methyltransferase